MMLGGHYGLGPPSQRGGTLVRERVNAAFDPGEPPVDIAQKNAGRVWDDRPNLLSAARAPGQGGGTDKRLLPIGGHDWHLGRSAESGITYPASMFLNQPCTALGVLAGTPWFRLNKHFDRPGGRYPE